MGTKRHCVQTHGDKEVSMTRKERQAYRPLVSGGLSRSGIQVAVYTLALLIVGILTGAVVSVLLLDSTLMGTGEFYTEYKQLQIRALIVFLPVLGGAAIVLSSAYLYLIWHHRPARWLTSAAIVCFVLASFVTFRLHFPLNAQIMSWSVQTAPDQWMHIQEQWWQAHVVRTGAILCGFILLLLNSWMPNSPNRISAADFSGSIEAVT
jgi:hypothetical protein